MELELIEPTESVAEDLEAYAEACRKWPDDTEYRQVLVALQVLAKGTPLLNVPRNFNRKVSLDAKGRPNLAIARADKLQVRVQLWHGHFDFQTDYRPRMGSPGRDTLVRVQSPKARYGSEGYALVPLVPPDVRLGRDRMAHHFILWEVEHWADSEQSVEPDRDPLLLRRVTSQLYAVIAQWDLTELEREVYGLRFLS